MTLTNTFLDSNIILYLFDTHLKKREIAKRLIRQSPHINVQVLVEVSNVCCKRLKWTKHEVLELWYEMMS